MTLDSMVQDATSGLFVPAQARRSVVPYADLQALNPPTTNPQISPDLISALSILVAQGPNSPLLLTTDVNGRLQTAGSVQPVTKLTGNLPSGQLTAAVFDSSSFYAGQTVTLVGAVSGTAQCTDVQIQKIPDAHTIVFTGTCAGFNYVIGDLIVGSVDTRITNVVVPFNIGGTTTMLPPGSPNPGDQQVELTGTIAGHKRFAVDAERSCDDARVAFQVQPAAASVTFPSLGAGNAYVLAYLYADILNNSGAATTPAVRVWDGASGVGTLKFARQLACPAAQSVDRAPSERVSLKGSSGNQMTIDFSVGGANIFETLCAGVWVEGV